MFYKGSQHEILPLNSNLTTLLIIFFFTADVIIGALVKDKTAVHIVYNEINSSPIPFFIMLI